MAWSGKLAALVPFRSCPRRVATALGAASDRQLGHSSPLHVGEGLGERSLSVMLRPIALALVLLAVAVGCSPPVPTPTPIGEPSPTRAVASAPQPTPTPPMPTTTPTVAPSPTALLVPTPSAQSAKVPLAAMFLSWYGFDLGTGECRGGLGTWHWNSDPNTAGVVYQPEKGYYCSADPDVVEWQLGLLEDIGVQALFVSWWGWGDGNLDGEIEGNPDMFINRGLQALFDGIKAGQRDIKVALIAEPFTLTQAGIHPNKLSGKQKQMILDWLWDNYYGKYPELMFNWQGKPLLIPFDPMMLPDDPRYTVRNWTGRVRDKQTEAEGWRWFFGVPQDVIEGMSDDGVAFVYPRFDEQPARDMGATYMTWRPRQVDPHLSEGQYEKQWQLLEANRSKVKMIILYGWNLYGEQAHIEPSWGDPAPVGTAYVEKTKDLYGRFLERIAMTLTNRTSRSF